MREERQVGQLTSYGIQRDRFFWWGSPTTGNGGRGIVAPERFYQLRSLLAPERLALYQPDKLESCDPGESHPLIYRIFVTEAFLNEDGCWDPAPRGVETQELMSTLSTVTTELQSAEDPFN